MTLHGNHVTVNVLRRLTHAFVADQGQSFQKILTISSYNSSPDLSLQGLTTVIELQEDLDVKIMGSWYC